MNDFSAALPVPRPPASLLQSPGRVRVALLVDGDNLSHSLAGALILKSAKYGDLIIKRVYGNMVTRPGWDAAPGFKTVHSGTGKNAADLLLTVEAMALMLTGQADVLVIASSDRDFSHLAQHLTERGLKVIGMGEAKAPDHFRKSCTTFHEIGISAIPAAPPTPKSVVLDPLVQKTRDLIAQNPAGLLITLLATRMSKDNAFQISQTPYKTWRAFLTAFPDQFDCDAKGTDACVRLRH